MHHEKKTHRRSTLRSILTALACFCIGLGILIWPQYTADVATAIAGVYMILGGLLRIRDGLHIYKETRPGVPVNIESVVICSAVEIVAGLVCGFAHFLLPGGILTLMGATLMVYGVAEAVSAALIARKRRQANRAEEPTEGLSETEELTVSGE